MYVQCVDTQYHYQSLTLKDLYHIVSSLQLSEFQKKASICNIQQQKTTDV